MQLIIWAVASAQYWTRDHLDLGKLDDGSRMWSKQANGFIRRKVSSPLVFTIISSVSMQLITHSDSELTPKIEVLVYNLFEEKLVLEQRNLSNNKHLTQINL